MSEGIFLQGADGLTVLQQQPYDSEAVLQAALAQYPQVIAGSTTSGKGEAQLILLRREMAVPSEMAGTATFSLDHLFVDADGVPVLVEVKRSSDTRIRREVVGQMLDYAANGVKYWPLPLLQQALRKTAEEVGRSSEELIAELDPDIEIDEFWRKVEANLKAGRIRMIFAADALPPELVRIIEFLNEQMTPAEVLGVELQQYVGGTSTVFVPRVIGQTSEAQVAKGGGAAQLWDRASFLLAAQGRCPAPEVAFMERLIADAEAKGKVNWGRGATPGVAGWYPVDGRLTGLWVLNANNENPSSHAYLVFYLADLVPRIGADRVDHAAEILERIPALRPKVADARASDWRRYPSVQLRDVVDREESISAVFEAIAGWTAAP